jgi:hypothetical protein
MLGRFSAEAGRSAECAASRGRPCPALVEDLRGAVASGALSAGVVVTRWSHFFNLSGAFDASRPRLGDQASLACLDGTAPQHGANVVVCTANGTWAPDPRVAAAGDASTPTSTSSTTTKCDAQYCANAILPAASTARITTSVVAEQEGAVVADLKAQQAPTAVEFRCDPSAQMLRSGTLHPLGHALSAVCKLADITKWVDAAGAEIDFDAIKCRCDRGFKQGTGDAIATCTPCLDGTYAPLNAEGVRDECRGCPLEGADCNGGVLALQKDVWYDAAHAATTFGIGPATRMYPCAMRDACLRNATAAPMTMHCHENHTSALCERCYHRRVDCGRGGGGTGSADEATCPAPGYFERGAEWMFFAKIARHCVRCPAGDAAAVAYAVTVGAAVVVGAILVALVLQQLNDVKRRISETTRDGGGEALQKARRANQIGPIARLLLNFLQATALLSGIKFSPPEAVKNASIFAEYAQGFSVNWFPVKCTLRWDYFATFAWDLASPPLTVALIVIVIRAYDPTRRALLRAQVRAAQWRARMKQRMAMRESETADLRARRAAAAAKAVAARRRAAIKEAVRRGEEPPTFEAGAENSAGVEELEGGGGGAVAAAASLSGMRRARSGADGGSAFLGVSVRIIIQGVQASSGWAV